MNPCNKLLDVMRSVTKIVIAILLFSVGVDAQEREVTLFSPLLSVRDSKDATKPFDFLFEVNWIEIHDLIVDELKLEMGYERERGEYYWSNDYRLEIGILYGAVSFQDFRRDDRGIHSISLKYLYDKYDYISFGTSVMIDKTHKYFFNSVINLDVGLLRFQYAKGLQKTIYEGEISYSKPLKQWWIFQTYMQIIGKYYHDTDFNPSRQIKIQWLFKLT